MSAVVDFGEGDGNSRFFHAMVNGRRRKNFVRVLIMDRVWEDNLSRVKHEVNKGEGSFEVSDIPNLGFTSTMLGDGGCSIALKVHMAESEDECHGSARDS